MKKILLLLVVASLSQVLFAQNDIPRLSKKAIGQSGCYAYFPEGIGDFELSKSEDGADVYTGEVEVDGFRFACITVKFVEPFSESTPEEMEELLMSYMSYLQEHFDITESVGVGKGHTLESAPDARGAIDYWQDAEGIQFVVKGWIDRRALGIMMIYGVEEYPHFNLQQMYLDGFRFSDK